MGSEETVLSVEEMRMSEAAAIRAGIPSKELMKRAGEGIFRSVRWNEPVAVVCGKGNNAGDGYVVASLLSDSGISCGIILLSDSFSEDGRYYFDICTEKKIPVSMFTGPDSLNGYSCILDCIFGTGFRGEARGTERAAIEAVNSSGAFVVSADINSGLNGDTGEGTVYVKSDITVSVGYLKTGHLSGKGPSACGKLINVGIGIDPIRLNRTDE